MATITTRSGKGSPLTHNEVDANFTNLNTDKLELSGGTMTGDLILNAGPTVALGAATKQYVDTIAAAGIHYHDPVRVESPSNLNATYDNGTSGVGATLTNAGTLAAITVDGVALSLNDRVLVYSQTNAAHNGVYAVTTVGDGSTAWVLTRTTDTDSYGTSDPDALGQGDAFFVKEGDTGAGELYVMNTEGTITFGTTSITFSQIAETAVYSAGTGLTLDGTTFNTVQDISTTASPTFAGATVNGNVVVTGTVDGRDIAADGAKIDGIEANADVTDATNVEAAGAVMDGDIGSTVQAYDANLTSFVSTFTLPTTDGSADQILKTDGSGNLAFADASGGGTIQLTAAEALSAGDPVVVNSSGKAAVVTGGSGSLVENYQSFTTGNTGTLVTSTFAHWSETSQKLGFFYRNGIYFSFGYGSVDQTTGAVSSTGTATIQFPSTYAPDGIGVYDATADRHIAFVSRYNGSSTDYWHCSVSPTGYASSLQTWSTGSTWTTYSQNMCLVYHGGIGKCLIIRAGSGGVYAAIITLDGSGNVSIGTETQISTSTSYSTPHAVYDPDNDIVSLFMSRSSQSRVYWQGITVSGSTITSTSVKNAYIGFTPAAGTLKAAYDKKEQCYAITGRISTASGIIAIECDGSTISTRGSALTNLGGSYATVNLEYIEGPSQFAVFHHANYLYIRSYFITASGIERRYTTGYLDDQNTAVDVPYDGSAAVSNNLIMIPFEESNNVVKIFSGASAYNNQNYDSFIGFSDGSYTSGATATINVVGSINTSQTGLTTGTKYYVQSDGTLGTSADTIEVSAGTALSATSILVR
jgi:hypothetical protein